MPRSIESARRVLVIVQNLSVPLDRRVWLECQALTARGYRVSVICPRGPGEPASRVLDGVGIYTYRPAPEARSVLGFLWEFAYSWLRTAVLSVRVRRERGFDVIQACNPPDTYWLLAALWRIAGVRFVFDQHDLNPELFLSRFGRPSSRSQKAQLRALLWLERMTYRVADRVISTNGSYRAVALRRGALAPERVTVVRSGPDTARMRPVHPDPSTAGTGGELLVYLGIMGPQDGVDLVLDVVDELVNRRGRSTVTAALLGFGDCLDDLRRRSTAMGLDEHVRFTGRVGPEEIAQYLSAAKVGLSPDRKTPLNDVSTMNKTMEYMAYALPSVAFDLVETRVSGADTVLYVPDGDTAAFADAVEHLLDDDALRVAMSRAARTRVVDHLDWRPQSAAYVGVFDDLFGSPSAPVAAAPTAAGTPAAGAVDLDDEEEYAAFLLDRR